MDLKVPRVLDQSAFDGLCRKFVTNSDVSISLPQCLSVSEIQELVLFLLGQDSNDLRNLLLADMVEDSAFPGNLLEEVFHKGDIGCRVAVSLRDDLSPQLEYLCSQSPEEDVRSHYALRKAYRSNQKPK